MFLCHDCQRYLPVSKAKFKEVETTTTQVNYTSVLQLCTKISDLPSDHFCRQYVEKRKIPTEFHSELYFTENFAKLAEFAQKDIPNEPRLVIPFFNKQKKLFALQGRALTPSKQRYITIVYNKEEELIYGLDRADESKDLICVEGPIDSLFIKNGIAAAGSGGLSHKYSPTTIICLDNEPRNREIVSKNKKYLENKFRVVIWPASVSEKDINDMVLRGINVEKIIKENTFSGINGTLKLGSWKKV